MQGRKPVKISSFKLQEEKAKKTCDVEAHCPYKLLQDYVRVRPRYKSALEPFFVFQDLSPLKPELARKILKELLKEAGFEAHLYNFHSLRAGRAVDLRKICNLSVETIKELGRWSSNTVFTYLKEF